MKFTNERQIAKEKMMITTKKLSNITPLFANWDEVIIKSCLQGHMGQAYTDNEDKPMVAKIECLGFCFATGDANSPQAKELLSHLDAGLELQLNNEAWHNLVKNEMENKIYEFKRYKFKKDIGLFDRGRLNVFARKLPAGYEIVPIGESLFHELPKQYWADGHCSQFASFDEFQRYGLGYVVKFGDELICAASPYAYCEGMIDVQIDTVPEHRGKGIATACAAQLILSCIDRGVLPYWSADCDESRYLAEKLGYQLEKECICYGIKINVRS